MKKNKIFRLGAKLIDFLVTALLSGLLFPFGMGLAIVYILFSDGFFRGQSIGKRIAGLRVERLEANGLRTPCNFKYSMIRNLPFAVFVFFSAIPLLNILILFLGVVFCLMEAYFILQDEKGLRIGDIYAETRVVQLREPR